LLSEVACLACAQAIAGGKAGLPRFSGKSRFFGIIGNSLIVIKLHNFFRVLGLHSRQSMGLLQRNATGTTLSGGVLKIDFFEIVSFCLSGY